MRSFARTSRLLDAAVGRGVFPGAVIVVVDEGEPRLGRACGRLAFQRPSVRTTTATVYDLSSLTKVLGTTTLTLLALERGRLDLDTPVATLVPGFRGRGKRSVRVWHLLTHSSGLPAYRPFFANGAGREAIVARAAAAPLEYGPGTRSIYSDLGFMVLGSIVERALGARLDELFARLVARPLGLRLTRFVDLARAGARARFVRRHAVAPTGVRGGAPRHGAVDDDNAFAMGGIAGHAGLFGPAADVMTVALAHCRSWHGGGPFPRELVRRFCAPAGIPESTRALGWDTPAGRGSQAGDRFPRDAVGHLGFTGCSLWLAPARGLLVVLLTNRVNGTASLADIRRVRRAVHDAVLADLGG
ncbi:MAG: serine hydrolase [Deltaproteobacteria bacterium]|nr:serine hydrolase [Deltaproteobacteria bacterium]